VTDRYLFVVLAGLL